MKSLRVALLVLIGASSVAQTPEGSDDSESTEIGAANEANEANEVDVWERILGWLGWGKSTPIILRGTADSGPEGYGAPHVLRIDTGEASSLGLEEAVRSPVAAADGESIYALTETSLVRFHISPAAVTDRLPLPKVDPPRRLLRVHGGALYAVTGRGCLSSFDGRNWRTKTCDLNALQREELVERSRSCGTLATGVRIESGPPMRADVILREGRLSRRLTRDPERRANYDPVFSMDCSRIYYVSRERY